AVQAMPPASATAGAGAVTAQSGAEQVARIRERMHTMSPANCPSMRHVMTTQGVLPYIAQVLGEGGERLTMEDVEVQPLDFHCRCSKESFMGHMLTLPTAQLDAMRAEGGTPLVCQFCNEEYFVTPAELRELSLHAAQQPQQPQQRARPQPAPPQPLTPLSRQLSRASAAPIAYPPREESLRDVLALGCTSVRHAARSCAPLTVAA
ncbi:MAG: Hsp33 family molecular chaperone HslO, partial [Sphingomonas sp.]